MLDKRSFYINGEWVHPATPNDLEVINPSNEESCAVISLGDKADVDKAVSAARTAYQSWSVTPKEERISILKKIYDVYNKGARSSFIQTYITCEMPRL